MPTATDTLTEQFHLDVIEVLIDTYRIPATYEFPGCTVLPLDDGRTLWTGLHGWEYASVVTADGMGDESEAIEVDLGCNGHEITPKHVAALWALKVAALNGGADDAGE